MKEIIMPKEKPKDPDTKSIVSVQKDVDKDPKKKKGKILKA